VDRVAQAARAARVATLTPRLTPARLSEDKTRRLQELENELGVVLMAYEKA